LIAVLLLLLPLMLPPLLRLISTGWRGRRGVGAGHRVREKLHTRSRRTTVVDVVPPILLVTAVVVVEVVL